MMLHYLRREFQAATSEPPVAAFLLLSMVGALALGSAVFFSVSVTEFVLLWLLWSPVAVFAAAAVQLSLARHKGLDKLVLSNPVHLGAFLASRALLVLLWSLVALALAAPVMLALGASFGPPASTLLARGAVAYVLLVLSGTILSSFVALLVARLSIPLAMGIGAGVGLALLALGTPGYQTMTGRRIDAAALLYRGPSPWAAAQEIFHGDMGAAVGLVLVLAMLLALVVAAAWVLLRSARDAAGWTRPWLAAGVSVGLVLVLFAVPALVPPPAVATYAELESSTVGGFSFLVETEEGTVKVRGGEPQQLTLHLRALPPANGEPEPGTVRVALAELALGLPSGLGLFDVSPAQQEAAIVPDPAQPGAWIVEPTAWTLTPRGALSGGRTSTHLAVEVSRGEETAYAVKVVEIEDPAASMMPLGAAALVECGVAGWLAWRLGRRGRSRSVAVAAPGA